MEVTLSAGFWGQIGQGPSRAGITAGQHGQRQQREGRIKPDCRLIAHTHITSLRSSDRRVATYPLSRVSRGHETISY
jgi:hypothetical protein